MDRAGDYADLEIRIFDREAGGYPVELTLPYKKQFPRGYLRADSLPKLSGPVPARDGERLFEWLFADEGLKTAWAEARGAHPRRRVRLRIDAAAPELHAIPWELLRDPGDGGAAPQDLAASTSTPFSRYLAGAWEPGGPILKRPVRMLVAIADPQNLAEYRLSPVDAEAEWASLVEVTASLEVEPVRLRGPCSLPGLEAELRKGYHVLHFVGHGAYFEKEGKAVLYLAGRDDQVSPVSDAELAAMVARLLAGTGPGGEDRLRLVFLASCRTATRSPADAFRGLAPQLVAAEVPAVIAMQDRVLATAAREFSRVFYQGLLAHGLVDLACNQARSALMTGDFNGSGIPVLFSRLPTNQLLAPGDPVAAQAIKRQRYEPETVYISAGEFLMGSDGPGVPDYEGPQHTLRTPGYRIGKFPVTNAQYAEYVRRTGASISPKAGWELARVGQAPPEARLNHPAVGVSWDEAVAYCRWLSRETGRAYRLPTEAEWEKAARGAQDGRAYPWGDEAPDATRCNFDDEVGDTTPVGQYSPLGDSPYGVADMAGNVWEWTSTMWGRDRAEPDFVYPYPGPEGSDGRDDPPATGAPHREYRVCRGGSFRDDPARLRCSARARFAADTHHARRGFRVVLEL